jgi:tetratricopeptide (TPR) repeat protein
VLIRIVLDGLQSEEAERSAQFALPMPSWRILADQDMAALVTFVQLSWGSNQGPVTAADVAAVRNDQPLASLDSSRASRRIARREWTMSRQIKLHRSRSVMSAPDALAAACARRLWLVLLGVGIVIAALWVGAGHLVRRAQASRLPALPDLQSVPAAVRDQIVSVDAEARQHPNSAEAVGALGMVYHASLLHDRAEAVYALAETLDPYHWRWTYYRGLLAESRGETRDAVELLSAVTRTNPSWGIAWYRIGEAELKRGRLEPAGVAFERARIAPPATNELRPGSRIAALAVYATVGLARVALEQGDEPRARALVDEAERQELRFGPAERLRRQMDAQADRLPPRVYVTPADPLLDAVVRISRHVDLLLTHAAIAARAGDRPWREFLTRRAFEFGPRDPDVLLAMSAMLQVSGKPAEALEYLRQHETVSPNDHHGLVEQGQCLLDLGRAAEAEAVLRRAARVADAAAEYNLGMALEQQGRWDEARHHYERALTYDPFHARALNNLAVQFARHGDHVAARKLHARALAAAPDDIEVQTNVATGLLIDGRTANAIALLRRALSLDPESADAHNALGVALSQAGRLEEAIAEFREAIRLAPDHVDARKNLQSLTARLGPV